MIGIVAELVVVRIHDHSAYSRYVD